MRAKLAGVCLIAAALAATTVRGQEATPTKITDIRPESSDRATRLVLEATGPLASYTYYSPDPLTVMVDIADVDASQVPARINVGTREVDSVRVTTLARADGRSLARVEVRLASLTPYHVFSKGRALNLEFERPAAAAEPPTPVAPAPAAATAPTAEAATAEPPAAAAPAATQAVAAEPAPVPLPAGEPKATGPKATRIVAVTRDQSDGMLAFTVRADGRLQYRDFLLPNPDRLVVDFPDVTARASVRALDVAQDPVRKVRLGQFSAAAPRVARLVVDLSRKSPYRIIDGSDGVRIVFGESAGSASVPQAPLASMKPAEPQPSARPLAAAAVPLAAEPAPVAVPASSPAARPAALEPLALPEPQAAAPAPAAEQGDQSVGTACGKTGNLGTPISLDFKDGDLQDIFRLFSDISGLNVVVNPGVSGKVTLKLNEVPWGRALELILKTNGLGCVLEDNVIRIARLSDLQKEEQDRRKLAEEQQLAGDLIDYTKRISYAKADALSTVLKQAGALSPRGQINTDVRTNTLIIRDLPNFVEKARNLITELDTATPQVEIEARIVVTTRNFTRDIGVQWGFGAEASPRFGNTTGLTFPNSLVLNGGAVPSQLGIPADNLGPGGLSSGAGIGQASRGYAVNLPASAFNSAIGISMGNILGNFNLDVALTALERQGRGRLLSTPKVTTQNNQAAEIKQGVQIPIQTVSNNTVTVQFKDAVLTLSVTPQITDAGTVILNLTVENNSPDYGNKVNGIPPINTQSAKTIVLVRDGQTAVVGGIYQSTETTTLNQTPFLNKIPILGYLFKNKAVDTRNNELLLFITPRIVKS
ncbi:MAG TPA: type IV pilus secretin PilQ [Vicinamibacteria bacterium]|nr:type IV pilus secretin PilQ [Vicinamibacteria bacterium]